MNSYNYQNLLTSQLLRALSLQKCNYSAKMLQFNGILTSRIVVVYFLTSPKKWHFMLFSNDCMINLQFYSRYMHVFFLVIISLCRLRLSLFFLCTLESTIYIVDMLLQVFLTYVFYLVGLHTTFISFGNFFFFFAFNLQQHLWRW